MSFCPICGAHHDPNIPCADRAGELLRDAGIEPEPLDEKELNKTVKKANRSLIVLTIGVLASILLIILFPYVSSFHVTHKAARDDIESGQSWWERRNYERAIADYTEAITSKQLSKRELSVAYYSRAIAWDSKEDYDRAVADMGEAIRLDPSSIHYYARGTFWDHRGDYDKAIADYDQAIRMYPQYAEAYLSRGIILFNKGEFSSAASDLALSHKYKADIYNAIWLYLAREHNNGNGNADLIVYTQELDTNKWPGPVVKLFLGKTDPSTITAQAKNDDFEKQKEQMCEANFYLAEWHLLHKRQGQARKLFTKAQNECPKHFIEYRAAVSELQRYK